MDLLLPIIPKGTYFELIPSELIREILLYLPYSTLNVLEVNEDLFWRLKIIRDLPSIDLDFIIKFLSLKSKNPMPIIIERRQINNTNLVIITDSPSYIKKAFRKESSAPRGKSLKSFSWEELDKISYLIGIKLPTMNIYQAIYHHFTLFPRNSRQPLPIPSDKDFFLHAISRSIIFTYTGYFSDMIKLHLKMDINDKLLLAVSSGRFSYLIPSY